MEEKSKTKSQIICDAITGILMLISIIAYILVGFLTKIWHPTWLIVAISALVSGIIGIVCNSTNEYKKLKNKQENTDK